DIIEAAPRVVDLLEKANVELPPHVERIPEGAVRREPDQLVGTEPAEAMEAPPLPPSAEKSIRPSFQGDSEKYLWLLEHGCYDDDDIKSIEDFEAGESYRAMTLYFEDKRRKFAEA